MSRHYEHFWVFALIYNCLLHQLSLGSPVFVRHFLSEGTGRNIRHLPCVSRRTGETGVCMFAFTCAKANGTHLGTCIDRFYFGSCCKLEDEPDHVFPQDNTIDVDNSPLASKPFVTTSTVAESNDVPGNVDRLKTTTASSTRLADAPKTTETTQTTQTTQTTEKYETPQTPQTTPTTPTTSTTQTKQTSTRTTRRPPTSSQPTTESTRLSTFQSVLNTSELQSQTFPSLTSVVITRPTTTAPSSTPEFGQRITSKKPPFSSAYNGTKIPVTTMTNIFKPQSIGTARPRPSSSSSSTSGFTSASVTIRRNTTSSPNIASTMNVAKENLTMIPTTIPITMVTRPTTTTPTTTPTAIPTTTPTTTPTTIPMTIPSTILATRFPPRNATTPTANKGTQSTTQSSSAVTETKASSTRKPATTKKPVKFTTKRPNPPTKRPSFTPTTRRSPTTAVISSASPTKSTISVNLTASGTRKPTGPIASSSKKPIATVTKRPTSVASTTSKPANPTTSASSASKRPTNTTLRRPVTTTPAPSRNPVTSTTNRTTSATSARPSTSSSTKPASTKPVSSSTASLTEKPVKVNAPSLGASGSWTVTTETTRRPSTRPVSTSEPSRKPSTQPASQPGLASSISWPASPSTGQKNATSHTTVSNELDAEFASEAEYASTAATTATHGIVTWTSFTDDAEPSTKPPESSTVATEATETLEWTPITTPDGWIIIQSPTSSEKPEVATATQQRPVGTTPSSQTSPIVTAKPPTESTTKQTTATSTSTSTTTTTTSTTTTTTHRPTTQSSTYVEALSTFATVSLAPDFSLTESPAPPLNMTNYKDVCGRRLFPESRIVGGDGSTFGKWPWQISLRQWRTSTYLHKCGAALLNENWAITAAHCVQNVLPSDLLLRIGEHDLGNEEEPYGFQERRVQIVASHPNFDPRTFEFDLALMRFYEPVLPFQPNVLPICIPDNDEDYVGQTAFVTGWGRLYEDGPLPSVLQEVAVPVINNSVCEGMYRNAGYIEHIPHIFICAGWRKGGFDSCEGDSGGPLVIQRKRDKRWVLAGVISWGIGCAEPNQPGVYTRISEFREWINQILQF